MTISVTGNEQKIIESILDQYKDYTFYYYGSRVKGLSETTSDLDVLIKGSHEMPLSRLQELKEKFDNSNLPYIVNFSDYYKINKDFFARIKSDLFPYNWQEAKLAELATIKYGKNQKDVAIESGNIPIYGTGGILGYASKALYDKPSVLIGRKGTIDKVRYVTKPFWTVDTTFYTIINDSKIFPRYFYYLLSSVDFSLYNEGTTIPSLRIETLNRLEFTVPPLDVQKKIAGVLGALDDKIELNNKINNNLEQQAQALFNNIYNTNNNGTLADIVDVVESGSRPKGGAINKGIPSIGAENIEKFGVYDYSKEKFIDEIFYEKMKHGKVAAGDVLLYKDGAYTGKVSLALDGYPHRICAVNEHVFIIRGKSDVTSQFFLYFCLSDEKNKNYLHTLASSKAAQPGLNQSELLGLPIFIPASAVVKNFTLSVAPMMHKIASNAIENNKLSALRDVLLPKLMSGEIDVSKVDVSEVISADKSSFSGE